MSKQNELNAMQKIGILLEPTKCDKTSELTKYAMINEQESAEGQAGCQPASSTEGNYPLFQRP